MKYSTEQAQDATVTSGRITREDWAAEFFDEGFRETFSTLGVYDDTDSEVDAIVALLGLPPEREFSMCRAASAATPARSAGVAIA